MSISRGITVATVVAALVVTGCSLTPPARSPEDQAKIDQARSAAQEAEQKRDDLRRQHADRSAELSERQTSLLSDAEGLEGIIASIDQEHAADISAWEKAGRDRETYFARVEAAEKYVDDGCTGPVEGPEHAEFVGGFEPTPRHKDVLRGLERCRKNGLKEQRAAWRKIVLEARKQAAIELEDTFDLNNPFSRGDLTAKVSGTKLTVKMRGNFEGRARHSREQVEAWCAAVGGLFTQVTLRNSHGTFSCTPDISPKELEAEALAGWESSWLPAQAGETPVPREPGERPTMAADAVARRADLAAQLQAVTAELATVDAELAAIEAELAEVGQGLASVSDIEGRVDRDLQGRQAEWKQRQIAHGKRAQVAGAVLTGVGVGMTVLGVYLAVPNDNTGERALDPSVAPIYFGVSIPVLVAGIATLVGGSVHKSRARAVE